jgi:hypothetical protein
MAPSQTGRLLGLFTVPDAEGNAVGEVWITCGDDGHYLGRTDFINNFNERIARDRVASLMFAAERQDWAEIDRFHPEALPWFCRRCKCNYPSTAWRITPRFDDDGFLDSYRGRCPEGHERMIAD